MIRNLCKKLVLFALAATLAFGSLAFAAACNGRESEDLAQQLADLQYHITQLQLHVDQLQRKIDVLKNNDGGPVKQDFILTISVENATVVRGENFVVDAELKNNTDQDVKISSNWLFWPVIVNTDWHPFDDPVDYPVFRTDFLLRSGKTITNSDKFTGFDWLLRSLFINSEQGTLSYLETGKHSLRFRATFYVNWQQDDQQLVEIWSNTIILTVQ